MFTGVPRVVPKYESIRMMIYAHMRTRKRVVDVRHCVTVAFDPVFLCAECRGDLISSMEDPTVVGKFAAFL